MSKLDTKLIIDPMLRTAIESIVKEYKSDSILECPGSNGTICHIPAIPTGSISLDAAIGIGGIPKGRITIIAGEPGTAKSTLCLEIIKNEQLLEPNKINIYVDVEEGAFTADYADAIGVSLDPNKFLLHKPDYAEQAIEVIMRLVSTGKVGVVAFDSIAGAYTKEVADNTAEDRGSIGSLARLLSEQLKKLANKCGKTGTALIVTNQLRTQMSRSLAWKDITGGIAQKYYSSVRIDLSKEKNKDYSGSVDRETITAYISKNKVAPPYRNASFDVKFGEGILRESNILDVGVEKGIITAKGGGWYYFYDLSNGEEIASHRGRDNAVDFLVDNQEYAKTLEAGIVGFKVKKEYHQEDMPEINLEDEEDPKQVELEEGMKDAS